MHYISAGHPECIIAASKVLCEERADDIAKKDGYKIVLFIHMADPLYNSI
jgi:hypothetical protein